MEVGFIEIVSSPGFSFLEKKAIDLNTFSSKRNSVLYLEIYEKKKGKWINTFSEERKQSGDLHFLFSSVIVTDRDYMITAVSVEIEIRRFLILQNWNTPNKCVR